MTRKRFRRELTEAMQSYRWERDQALSRAHAAEQRADVMMDRLVRARSHRDFGGRLSVLLDCDDLLVHYRPVGDEYRRLAERIVLTLAGFARDGRGDLRQTDGQRLLGLPPRVRSLAESADQDSRGRVSG